jgi:hypothetical protein
MVPACGQQGAGCGTGMGRVVEGCMRCPACDLELGVERQAGEVVLRYSIKDWTERCRYQRGDPVLCANLMPTILGLLPEKATPFRSEAVEPRK